MKLNKALGLLCLPLLASCTADLTFDEVASLKSAYTSAWIKKFGLIDSEQNWNMATSVTVNIDKAYLDDNAKVNIYSGNPRVGGRLVGVTSKSRTIGIDVVKGSKTLYVQGLSEDGSVVSEGYVDIIEGNASISKSLRAPKNMNMAPVEADARGVFDWTIACEDLGTAYDYDFNDVVLGINHISGESGNKLQITPLAAGGILEIKIYVGSEYVGEIHDMLLPGADHSNMINTYYWDQMGEPIEVNVPSDWSIANDMGGISIEVEGVKALLEAPEPGNPPQLICIKGDWLWPSEKQRIEEVYPKFKDWNRDAEDLTWLETHNANVVSWKTETGNNNEEENDNPGTDTPIATPTPDKSSDMILSQAQKWSKTWLSNSTDNSKGKTWDYVPGLVTKAMLTYCEQYPDDANTPTYYSWAKEYADNAFNNDGSFNTSVFVTGALDNIASGKVLLSLYNITKESKYKDAAQYMYDYLRGTDSSFAYPRIASGDAAGGFIHKTEYPDQMWLDGLYMGAAFYAEYQSMVNPDDAAAWNDITKQFTIVHSKTYNTDKQLNYHGWSANPTHADSFWAQQTGTYIGCSNAFWGRGMGWYIAALVDVLSYMPESNANYSTLLNIYRQVAAGILRWQDQSSGVWYQLLDENASYKSKNNNPNYLEASASSMFTYALLKGLRLGLLDEATYRSAANKAYNGLIDTFITGTGSSTNINNICKSAGLGPGKKTERDGSKDYYLDGSDAPIVSNEGKGIGAFIFAALEYELSQAH